MTPAQSRQQDEVGEGAAPEEHTQNYAAGLEVGKRNARRELAKEIAERLRRGDANSGNIRAAPSSQDVCADWIGSEYGGE